MRCPECTQENPDDAAECVRCGLELAQWRRKVERAAPPLASSGSPPAPAARPRLRQDARPAPRVPPPRSSSFEHLGFLLSGVFCLLWGIMSLLNRPHLPYATAAIVIGLLLGAGLVAATFASPNSGLATLGKRLGAGVIILCLLLSAVVAVSGMFGLAVIGLCIAFTIGMILFGRVSLVRIVLASLVFAVLLAFAALVSAQNASALEWGAKLARTIRGVPVTDVQGLVKPYQLFLPPSTRWFEATRQPARADRVLFSPASNAMLSIFVELVPNPKATLDELGDTMLKNVRNTSTSFEVSSFNEVEREHLSYPTEGLSLTEGLLLRVPYVEGKRSYTALLALIRRGMTAYVLFGAMPTENYLTLAAGLRTMIEGFTPAEEAPAPAVPSPAPAAPTTPAERQAACRRKCEDLHSICDCVRNETPAACGQRCERSKLACLGGCQ